MNLIRIAITAATLGLAGLAQAGLAQAADRVVVVELFTSQGCSSCPPADKMVGELTKREDILPLALHVDYWDYIGWKDSFASPEFTQRQRGYAAAARSRSIYTPQMVVGGLDHVIGARPMELAEFIAAHRQLADVVDVELISDGTTLQVQANAQTPQPGAYTVVVVQFTPEATVSIRRGENAGRTITYHNIVTSMQEIGRWDGESAFSASVPLGADSEHAVLIQSDDHGPILTAARLR